MNVWFFHSPVSPKAKLPTAKSKILTRHRGVCLHSYNDTVNANAEVIIENFFRRFSSLAGAFFVPTYILVLHVRPA